MFTTTYNLSGLEGSWKKVNFHCHAGVCVPGKCGVLPLDEVAESYRQAKFDALAISNHDMYLPRDTEYEGIELIDAVEYSATPHMLQVGIRTPRESSHQEAIDRTNAEGGFAILCHPNWKGADYYSHEMLDALKGYVGIEVLNAVIYRLSGSGLALDKWDYVLSSGRLIFGFGNDDFHQWCDLSRSFNIIYAKSARFEDIKEAVLSGRFYVSSGVSLKSLTLENNLLTVEAGQFTETFVENMQYKVTGSNGKLLYECYGKSMTFELPNSEPYVRVEATAEHGAKMYLQPIYQRDAFMQ